MPFQSNKFEWKQYVSTNVPAIVYNVCKLSNVYRGQFFKAVDGTITAYGFNNGASKTYFNVLNAFEARRYIMYGVEPKINPAPPPPVVAVKPELSPAQQQQLIAGGDDNEDKRDWLEYCRR